MRMMINKIFEERYVVNVYFVVIYHINSSKKSKDQHIRFSFGQH